ncbi:NAD(P)-binding protein [Gonapodya prolifera JEL478]|uniref:NAD(P)-binding protein n=1 Tax=Gonapodya prolifera (strain JEL478) TaxID=1344416 RepID=A0A139A1C3_GONPJ|nr:NAD(P)-binding protein [Gonapodya prolifera JEL478]|eukprot:KXS10590.1 NAD(P)-binding protein [Gonapodya prolifera JEL478]
MSRLHGKTVLVTGASAGIGEATARQFAAAGSKVIIAARRADKLQEVKANIEAQTPGAKVISIELDVANREKVNAAIAGLPEEWKKIDVLVNNAGLVQGTEKVEEVAPEDVDLMINVNIKGLLYVTQAVMKGFRERNSGHIINVGSISGKDTYPGGGVYCGTKFMVDALTRTLRQELVDTPIRVSEINPGMVETEFSVVRFRGDKSKADNVYKGIQPLSGDDVAETIVFAASAPPHVVLADVLLLPTNQAGTMLAYRKP